MNWIKRANEGNWIIGDTGPINEEQESYVNERIRTSGLPPTWAKNWAIKQLESGIYKNQKEWEEKISEMIMSKKSPSWAEKWVRNKLKSGDFPKEWIAVIEDIMQNSYILHEPTITPIEGTWCMGWIGDQLKSGNFPEKWKDWIGARFQEVGLPPWWAYFYAKRMFVDGKAPPVWIEGIKKHIKDYVKSGGGFIWDSPEMHKAIYKYYPELRKADDTFSSYMLRSRLREIQAQFMNARRRKEREDRAS